MRASLTLSLTLSLPCLHLTCGPPPTRLHTYTQREDFLITRLVMQVGVRLGVGRVVGRVGAVGVAVGRMCVVVVGRGVAGGWRARVRRTS